jgi:hypothetical protein
LHELDPHGRYWLRFEKGAVYVPVTLVKAWLKFFKTYEKQETTTTADADD